ncbi:Jerky protein-like 16 [Homarus americanus]|uniref:Jerky protein-like 16 n=1 Tax=Homarus americanus TaxID=6706 RepID=A0A8J5MWW6_HOMAM|nr:Jerky protein-like 16 [Homarus americanus]
MRVLRRENILQDFQIYNGDETFFVEGLAKQQMGSEGRGKCPWAQDEQESCVTLVCENVDGTHRLKPKVVGNTKRPMGLYPFINQAVV